MKVTRLVWLLAILFAPLTSFAQEAEVMPQTVIFKLKPEYRAMGTDDSISIPVLNAALKSLQPQSVARKFPWITEQSDNRNTGTTNSSDQQVDVRSIYVIHYNVELNPTKVAAQLMRTGVLAYAEPWYIPVATVIPNDQYIDDQWHHEMIRSFEAWDIDTGKNDVVIAIVDTGVDKDHPDLVDNLLVNQVEASGEAGVDDDSNGFVDDVLGWNFFNDNNDVNETGFSHGTHVAGLAGATTNNDYGIAGVGWQCKILPIKAGDKLQLPFGYDGVLYAAAMGADVINCSWGSFGASQYAHDVMKAATYNYNALVVAGAGNDNRQNLFYPASFSEVVSVGASDTNDAKSDFSNYNYYIDLIAPGSLIYSLKNDTFGYDSGTSMSAPIVAGAAGLIRSRFPSLSALQVREQLRVSADASIYELEQNQIYANKLGTGRLDVLAAVTAVNSPALRIEYAEFSDGDDQVYTPGETVSLGVELVNYLQGLDDITLTLTSLSEHIQVIDGIWSVGSLGENARLNNVVDPFEMKVLQTDSHDVEVIVKMTATSASSSYVMEEFLSFVVNPSYVNITVNNVSTTIAQNGLVGFTDLFQSHGLGFQLDTEGNLVYECGLMIGHRDDIRERVVDRIRGPELYDRDFWQEEVIARIPPVGNEAYLAQGSFTDTSAIIDEIGFLVQQKAYAYNDPGHQHYVVVEYTIVNKSGKDLSDLAVGMFADWDIKDASANKAETVQGKRLGYVYSTGAVRLTAGIQALSDFAFNSYMIDNVSGGYGGIDMYDEEDYSSRRKYKSMNVNRFTAGAAGEAGLGNDVIQVVACKGIDLAKDSSVTVAFAIHAGKTIERVLESADSAFVRHTGYAPGANVSTDFEVRRLFPNPADDHLTIEVDAQYDQSLHVNVYNVQGVLIQAYTSEKIFAGFNTIELQLPVLGAGVYYLELKSEGHNELYPIVLSGRSTK
jgi:serine protease